MVPAIVAHLRYPQLCSQVVAIQSAGQWAKVTGENTIHRQRCANMSGGTSELF